MKEKDLIRLLRSIEMSSDRKIRLKEKLVSETSDMKSEKKYANQSSVTEIKRRQKMLKSKKRIGGLIAVAIMALGITVFAASGIVSTWYSSSSSRPDYRSLPTAEQVNRDIGYDVILIDHFFNGYTFRDGSIVRNKLDDENGQTIENFKSVMFRYKKGKDEVEFSQERFQSQDMNTGTVAETFNGVEIWYDSYVNKIVPPDYKMTEEDKKAEENGELVFSYGSDKVELVTWQSVVWCVGDMHYQLFQQVQDGSLSKQDLIAMAKEILERRNPKGSV